VGGVGCVRCSMCPRQCYSSWFYLLNVHLSNNRQEPSATTATFCPPTRRRWLSLSSAWTGRRRSRRSSTCMLIVEQVLQLQEEHNEATIPLSLTWNVFFMQPLITEKDLQSC
jgi:hypothetical protein